MVESIYDYKINPKLFELLHCPTCKSKLYRTRLIDIFIQGLACRNNHRFFIELKTSISTEEKCAFIKGASTKDRIKLIKLWLSNFKLRSKLNNQLATIIRRIYEISKDNRNVVYDYGVFKYCPLCSNPLEEFQQSDIWFQGLRCNKNHNFLARNGVSFSYKGRHINLKEEMPNDILFSLIQFWLKERRGDFTAQIHPQIKLVMVDFIKNYV